MGLCWEHKNTKLNRLLDACEEKLQPEQLCPAPRVPQTPHPPAPLSQAGPSSWCHLNTPQKPKDPEEQHLIPSLHKALEPSSAHSTQGTGLQSPPTLGQQPMGTSIPTASQAQGRKGVPAQKITYLPAYAISWGL